MMPLFRVSVQVNVEPLTASSLEQLSVYFYLNIGRIGQFTFSVHYAIKRG